MKRRSIFETEPRPMTLKKALEFMARGSCLINQGGTYYVVPGGNVQPDTAAAIKKRVDVRGGKDSLFPGLDQTWRMIRDEVSA